MVSGRQLTSVRTSAFRDEIKECGESTYDSHEHRQPNHLSTLSDH